MDAPTGSIAPKPRPSAAKLKPTATNVKSSAVTSQGANAASPTKARLSTKLKTTADVGPSASNTRPGAARAKPSTPGATKPSATGVKHHAANVNPSAARPKPSGVVKPPQAGVAGSKPNAAAVQTVSAQLGKRAVWPHSLDRMRVLTSFICQTWSIKKRSGVSMMPTKQCQRHAQTSRRRRLPKKIGTRSFLGPTKLPLRFWRPVVRSSNCSQGTASCSHHASKSASPFPCVPPLALTPGIRSHPHHTLLVQVLSKVEAGRHEGDVRVAVVHFDLVSYLSEEPPCDCH